ncbi:acetylcholinesterase-1 [Caerostris extrusa]|uniref:Carboxylic ester hydrolase n=1 Tax=Caerostris extrusa TaxID=172846 RepID=A0AAV4VER1_CAEEX|nr:acetylcholinesterase-1 [Caerostris extrusa]
MYAVHTVSFPWYDSKPGKSEDCLYLNIYAPFHAKEGNKKAVLFWIFGGGFTFGSNPLFDIVMALQWVNDNIESFGGDKDRITLHGQSAGSIAISLLCVSPLARGMFSRVIMQSGSTLFLRYNQLKANLQLSQRLAKAVGWQNAAHLSKILWSFNPTSGRSFFPHYGDELLPNNALDDIRHGNFHNVPLLIGNNKDEGSFQITTGNRIPLDSLKYVDYYLKNIPDEDYDLIRRQLYTASGDSSLLCETVYFAESYAEKKNDVYYYFFVHRPSNTPWYPWMGVAHYEEVQFIFGRPFRKPKNYKSKEIELSGKMIKIWTDFAKNGYPSDSFIWPKYSKENHTFVYIDANFRGDHLGSGPHLDNCNFLRSHFGF